MTQTVGVRYVDKLMERPSNWRILNLFHVNKDSLPSADETVQPPVVSMFQNRKLNAAIFIKHNVRSNESQFFEKAKMIATKVMLPVDKSQHTMGAKSFFIGERCFPQIIQELTGLPVSHRTNLEDMEKLQLVDQLPTLDLMIVKEKLEQHGHFMDIPATWLDESLQAEARRFIRAQLEPLLQLALKRQTTNTERERFMIDVFFTPTSDVSLILARSLRVPQSDWAGLMFSWKASIYYEWLCEGISERFKLFMSEVQRIKVYSSGDMSELAEIEMMKRDFVAKTSQLYEKLRRYSSNFDETFRVQFIKSGDPIKFRDYLYALQRDLYDLGIAYALLEHVISYWDFAVRKNRLKSLPADAFSAIYGATLSMHKLA